MRETVHPKCGINFPPTATVGSLVMAVCDTVPGGTNPVEGVIIYELEHSGNSGPVISCSHTVADSPWLSMADLLDLVDCVHQIGRASCRERVLRLV